jgi:hypothetical protein
MEAVMAVVPAATEIRARLICRIVLLFVSAGATAFPDFAPFKIFTSG